MNKVSKWEATSPSQAKTYLECARKWWFEKIEQVQPPAAPSGSQSLGSRLHAEIEAWLEKGLPPGDPLLQPTFDTWLHQFQAPQPYVEYHFTLPVGDTGVMCRGYIDFVDVDPSTGVVTVWDHKTTKSTRYMKTSEGLRDDPQCLVYLYAIRHLGTSFRFGHHYVRTDKPTGPTFVTVDKTLEEVEEGWDKFVGMTREMALVVVGGERPEGDTSACWNYGGCPFRETCFPSPVRIDSDFSFMYPPAETPMPGLFDTPATTLGPGDIVVVPRHPWVYVDCSPLASPPVSFTEWAKPLVDKYAEMKGVHPLVEAYQVGVRGVALEAARVWQDAPVDLFVSTADPIGQLFSTLIPSSNVVRRLG